MPNPNPQIAAALAAQGAWKSALWEAARTGETKQVSAQIDECGLETWLQQPESRSALGVKYHEIVSANHAYRAEARRVADMICDGQTSQALVDLDRGRFSQASTSLRHKLVSAKRPVSI